MQSKEQRAIEIIKSFLNYENEHNGSTCQIMNGFGNDDKCDCGAEKFINEAKEFVKTKLEKVIK